MPLERILDLFCAEIVSDCLTAPTPDEACGEAETGRVSLLVM